MGIFYFLAASTGIYAVIAQMAGWSWGPQLLVRILDVLIMIPIQFIFELVFAILEGIISAFD